MATFVLKSAEKFPVGTTVSLYPASARNRSEPKLGPPVGAAISTAVVAADGSLTFVGAQPGVAYLAFATTFGYVEFQVPHATDFTEPDATEMETMPLAEAVTNIASPGTGVVIVAGGIILPRLRKISRIVVKSGSVAAVTPTNQWFALLDRVSRRVLARTVDDLAGAWAADTEKDLALQEVYTVPDDRGVLVAVCVAAATPPSFRGQTVLQATAQQGGTSSTGQTTPPALGTQLAAITPTTGQIWARAVGGVAKRAA